MAGVLPGFRRSQIFGVPDKGVAVFADGEDKQVEFCEAFRAELEPHEPSSFKLDNIEVSKVSWSALNFVLLMDTMKEYKVWTERLKAFKCALDDESLCAVADWLEEMEPEKMPSELHFSNNAFTASGFERLVEVIQNKRSQLEQPGPPVWLRVENNPVQSDPILQTMADDGRIAWVGAIKDRRGAPSSSTVAMPFFLTAEQKAQQKGQSQQKGGKGQQKGGKSNWWDQQGQNSAHNTANAGDSRPWSSAATAQQLPWRQNNAQPDRAAQQQPAIGRSGGFQAASRPVAAATQARASASFSSGKGEENKWWDTNNAQPNRVAQQQVSFTPATAAARTDRSRTPQPPKNPPLPHPWTEEFSDEYKIPYFWNPETGDSMWERPTA